MVGIYFACVCFDNHLLDKGLPPYQRHEVVFLSCNSLGARLGFEAVAQAAKCSNTATQHWLDRWKEFKDLADFIRFSRSREMIQKQVNQILSLADQEMFAASRDIESHLKKKGVQISQTVIWYRLNEGWETISSSIT